MNILCIYPGESISLFTHTTTWCSLSIYSTDSSNKQTKTETGFPSRPSLFFFLYVSIFLRLLCYRREPFFYVLLRIIFCNPLFGLYRWQQREEGPHRRRMRSGRTHRRRRWKFHAQVVILKCAHMCAHPSLSWIQRGDKHGILWTMCPSAEFEVSCHGQVKCVFWFRYVTSSWSLKPHLSCLVSAALF